MVERIEEAKSKFKESLGTNGVISNGNAQKIYGKNEMAVRRDIPFALKPKTSDEIKKIVKIAAEYKVPLYPISTGNNWGYGAATPVKDGCVVVDLSDMDKILEMDEELGVVVIEPGVTPKKLRNYLDEKNLPYLVPVSGAGPFCSILGNALERGYGVTPYVDHFSAVMSIEAILPDGTEYKSALSEMGGITIDKLFKWGIGPYLDGLFSQSSFAIVTKMAIALSPTPDKTEAFLFGLKDEKMLGEAVLAIRDILKKVGNITGSINLMNARRLLSMVEEYPRSLVKRGEILPQEMVDKIASKNYIGPWTVAGVIYGDRKLVSVAKKHIRKRVGRIQKRLMFFSRNKINFFKDILNLFPDSMLKTPKKQISNLEESFNVAEGSPTEIALPLCYWKSGNRPAKGEMMNPAKDDCGVIWYSPLVPMRKEDVSEYADMINRICPEFGIEPLITLTSLSSRCFDSTIPILFDPTDKNETERAHKCYEKLFNEGKKKGFIPYRVSIESMKKVTNTGIPFFNLVEKLKKSLDPKEIISPGRYSK